MSKAKKSYKSHPVVGWICILFGIYPLAIASGFLNVDSESVHAPMWIVGLCGLVFIIAGCMILFRQYGRLVDMLAAFVCLSFAVVGIWVSLFSPSDGFSGGIPFVSKELNHFLARGMFGLGAIISLLICTYAIKRALR